MSRSVALFSQAESSFSLGYSNIAYHTKYYKISKAHHQYLELANHYEILEPFLQFNC